MTTRYADEIAMATELLGEFGTTVTVQRVRQATPVKATDRPTDPPTRTTCTPKAVMLAPPGNRGGRGERTAADSLAVVRSRVVYIEGAAMTFDPESGDVIDGLEGRLWNILEGDALRPDGGSVILYRVEVAA